MADDVESLELGDLDLAYGAALRARGEAQRTVDAIESEYQRRKILELVDAELERRGVKP